MRQITEPHSFTGMQKDLGASKFPVQFIYNGLNIRLTAREGDTLLSVTNERGTDEIVVEGLEQDGIIRGTYLGHCLLNQYLVIFSVHYNYRTGQHQDYIQRINLDGHNYQPVFIFGEDDNGDLGFNPNNLIEAIPSYENEHIQKVYWIDGKNQPRMVNIIGEIEIVGGVETEVFHYNNTSFDFIRELQLNEDVHIRKELGSGMFAPGVIQYALTYYTKHGQESNIFYTSPLLYISYRDRGAAPDDTQIGNSFKITVDNIDSNFDYLRIYSIQRTSLDGTPMCKRVQDIYLRDLSGTSVSFLDTGTTGNSVDPTELLYKGGESIVAGTIEQKDNTLFLGNIGLKREQIDKSISSSISLFQNTRTIHIPNSIGPSYPYANQLTAYGDVNHSYSVPCCGFKRGNSYRCGVQFQYKDGKWSDPLFIKDEEITSSPSYNGNTNQGQSATLPIMSGTVPEATARALMTSGYRKARAVVVFPDVSDRNVLCQGVTNPTMYRESDKFNSNANSKSSWFFRPKYTITAQVTESSGIVSPKYTEGPLPYTSPALGPSGAYSPSDIRRVEIQGSYDEDDKFKIDWKTVTLHSPDVEFDDQYSLLDFTDKDCQSVGLASFVSTMADIDIQTETPTISPNGSGFFHKSFVELASNHVDSAGIISGLFYDDYFVDDLREKLMALDIQKSSVKWLVYPWQRNGSLNNDINRPADSGIRSAVLRRKIISNLRVANTDYDTSSSMSMDIKPQIFNSDQVSIVKLGDNVYSGNVDTLLSPKENDGLYFAFDDDTSHQTPLVEGITTTYASNSWWKTFAVARPNPAEGEEWNNNAIYKWNGADTWVFKDSSLGDKYLGLVLSKESVRMKYKSTPHLVMKLSSSGIPSDEGLPIVEITQTPANAFGGISDDALQANTWIPCGEAVRLDNITTIYVKDGKVVPSNTTGATAVEGVHFGYDWGDTYYQRWDCLKTYAFTPEDVNQVVEIGSFMLETYVNIDGRYDRNRGQLNNTMMSPLNFNLLNPVYSQANNFFSYKILDKEFYKMTQFPNQITWSKEKQAGADTDLWTNITLASTYDMDGSKGEVISLNTWKDNIYCFQNKGVSAILFNSRVQIPTSDGMPIEITNNYKVDGYRYISDGIGCNDKRLIKETPVGIYFLDSISKHLFYFGEGFTDLSEKNGMSSWFKQHGGTFERLLYDDINHDLYAVPNGGDYKALCYSEKLGQFTGLYDYNNISLIETYGGHVFTLKNSKLYKMFEGACGDFFGLNKPWSITFISNGLGNGTQGLDKTFTNLEFRAVVAGDGEVVEDEKFKEWLPFDEIEVWDEYQHGLSALKGKDEVKSYKHHSEEGSALLRKFRIWRCDIPRDNYSLPSVPVLPENPTEEEQAAYEAAMDDYNAFMRKEASIGINRYYRKPLDRMRNPWLFVTLRKKAAETGESLPMTELNDLNVQYYI